ncbi:MAG: rhomboid family intramembrane serine protease [Salinibacter sp.]
MEQLLTAPITLALLLANVGISGYAMGIDPSLLDELSFRPRRIRERGEYYRFLTAGFVHAGGAHLAFNMITLYFFGPQLERILGVGAFLVLYFGSELAAHALTFAMHHHDPQYAAVGASGAISGVLFAFCLYAPLALLGIMFVIPMPAILFAVLYVVVSIYAIGQRQPGMRGGIAHEAHLGGALGGVVLTILLDYPRPINAFLSEMQGLWG